jgi:nitrogenase-stabilizing/protective protein
MITDDFETDLEALESAEDFLEYFQIPFDPKVVQVNRLHILQRFHDYLAQVDEMPDGPRQRWALHADLLGAAYQDFVVSDAMTEKVFRVFHAYRPQNVQIPVEDLLVELTQPGSTAQEGPHAA